MMKKKLSEKEAREKVARLEEEFGIRFKESRKRKVVEKKIYGYTR